MIELQMGFEAGAPWFDVRIAACEPPHRLELRTTDPAGEWHLELRLAETVGGTELTFVHHLPGLDGAAQFGPGWEYYLDMLVAARGGTRAPDFADYDPAQLEHFTAQARAAAAG